MRFSVVTICLNAERYLEETMESVLRQTWTDFEYILVDGGSTDGTHEIIRSLAEQDSRVRWVIETMPGIAHAMNYGLELARGEVIAYLHSDDRYADKQILERVASTLRDNPGVIWVTGGLREIDGQGGVIRTLPALNFTKRRLLRNNIIYHPATFVKSATVKAVGGFDEGLRYAMDYDLWLRLADFSGPCQCDGVLADFRVHPGSRSSAERDKALAEEYLVRKRYLGRGALRWQHACYQWLRTHYEKWMAG